MDNDNIFDDLFNIFGKMNDLYTQQRELAAIWLERGLVTGEGKTCRIAPDATVRVENNQLVDCSEDKPPTHKVIGCIGTLISKYEFTLVDLVTSEPLQIILNPKKQ